MKDDDAIPLEPVTDEATEARIVAWVLGEASAFEITELERLCAEKPELEIFRRRMLALQGLLKDSASDADDAEWKLPATKRERVLETIGADNVGELAQEKRVSRMGLRVMFGIAACLLVTLIVARLVNPRIFREEATASLKAPDAIIPASSKSQMEKADLRQLIREQEDRVEERRKALSMMVRQKGIIYRGDDSFFGQGGAEEDDAAKSAAEVYTKLEQEKIQLESQIQSLLKYNSDQLMVYASGLDLPENGVKTLYPQYLEARRELDAAKNKGLGESHPEVQKLAQQTENLKKDLDEGTMNLRATLETQARLTDARLAKVEILKGEKKDDSILRGSDTTGYVAAKEEFESELAKLNELKLQVAGDPTLASRARPRTVTPASPSIFKGERNKPMGEPELAERSESSAGEKDAEALTPQAGVSSARSTELSLPASAQAPGTGMGFGYADTATAPEKKEMAARNGAMDYFSAPPTADSAPVADGALMKLMDSVELTDESGPAGAADPVVGNSVPEPKPNDKLEGDLLSVLDSSKDATHLMTGGLRSGDQAITRNNIDAILNNPNRVAEGFNFGVPSFLGEEGAVAASDAVAPGAPMADPFAADDKTPSAKLEAAAPAKDQLRKQLEEKSKLAPSEPPAFDTEIIAAEEPFSTFSLNVSDVSFQLAKAALERGERPAPESIKLEQFYNAVDYGDAAPSSGEPVAGVVEQSAHPIIPGRNLVRMGVRTAAAGRSAAQPLRLTLLVDQSGSMVREDRKAAMEKAVAGLGQLLTEADRISVIGFSRTSRLIAENLPGNKITELGALVNPEASEGGTNLEEALRLSEVIANRYKLDGAQNRIVLFTDGAANLGDADPARLAGKVKAMRQEGIAFDVAGIGAEDLNDRLLAELARNGNGRYYVAADNLAAQLAGAFRPAAEDVKVQVKFNPQRVKGYRLIGFEESRLKTEDFRNDAIDAAELAAEEAAVALYQVEVLPGGTGEIGEMSVRFREAGTGHTVERSWTIPYDSATPAFDKATASMKLAGLSMLAAEKLKGGPLADATNLRELAKPLADAKKYYKDSRKVADMARVIELLAK